MFASYYPNYFSPLGSLEKQGKGCICNKQRVKLAFFIFDNKSNILPRGDRDDRMCPSVILAESVLWMCGIVNQKTVPLLMWFPCQPHKKINDEWVCISSSYWCSWCIEEILGWYVTAIIQVQRQVTWFHS